MTDNRPAVNRLSDRQGLTLVQLARQTIARKLGRPIDPEKAEALETALADPDFDRACGTFVTLTLQGRLRGCIGSLEGSQPLRAGIPHNAVNAALHDPRFPPLKRTELDQIAIEISILTRPRPLDYTDGRDLLARLRRGIDGVILRKGSASATFLPQVWQQLPRPQDFLSHLCTKAGLAANAWQTAKLEVRTYQVQHFHEQQ